MELDYLVVDNELILEPNLVKTKVDVIIENEWSCQYQPLEYIFDGAFSDVMCPIGFDKLFGVVSDLSNGKTAGFSESVFTNTHPITLIKTAHKIFSKILSNRISLACSSFDVLHIGLVIEDALEKNHKLWLVMTNFGLTVGYYIHDNLDQGKVKRQESVYRYKLNSYFISKNSHLEPNAGLFFFFAVGAFHILNIVSEFFWVNNIFINTDKTVAISINCRVSNPSLFISGIFLSTEGLSKPSLAKAQSDVWFFSNLVLRKVISNKQFLYLVSAVFYPIVSYRTQFSFIPFNVCNKWDILIHKDLKLKSGLPLNFPNNTIHYSFFYGLKSFKQVQSESKIASLVNFVNSNEILGHMFSYRSHNLQVLCWYFIHPLSSLVCIRISSLNNFLAGIVRIFAKYNLSLSRSLSDPFHCQGGVLMLVVLEEANLFVIFFNNITFFPVCLSVIKSAGGSLNILESQKFKLVCDQLSYVSADCLSVYIDGSLRDLGTIQRKTGAAVFFENIGLGLSVKVSGLLFSTLAKLQVIALVLECVLLFSLVCLYSDSQIALNACKLEVHLICLNFHIQYWVKDHLGIVRNDCADALAVVASNSDWFLPFCLKRHCLLADGDLVSGNSRHFLFVAVRKQLYSKHYSSVLCLFCGDIEIFDHVFSCKIDLLPVLIFGLSHFSFCVSQLLSSCAFNVSVFTSIFKETVSVFHDFKLASWRIVNFVHVITFMEKNRLILPDGLISVSISEMLSGLSAGVVRLLGIADTFGVHFGFHRSCSFFSGVGNDVLVYIVA
ncbi:hypothetical protein G9A89_004265 [Geosiphon pyriformis]|nr:hypothetical protein G9A89_004265 [Geosiphon pyriformis]